jgi:hypothetical protein
MFYLLKDNKVIVPSLFFTNPVSFENPYIEKSLYVEFSNLINNDIISFNYNNYLEEFNDEELNSLLNELNYIEYNLIHKFKYSNLISHLLISKLFFTSDIFIIK